MNSTNYDMSNLTLLEISTKDFFDKSKFMKVKTFMNHQFYKLVPLDYYLAYDIILENLYISTVFKNREPIAYYIVKCENNTFTYECGPL